MNIEQLKKEADDLRYLLQVNSDKQKELNKTAFTKKHGVDIGDVIEWMDGMVKKVSTVCDFKYSNNEVYNVVVLLHNKDGNIGLREAHIWSWNFNTIKLISKAK